MSVEDIPLGRGISSLFTYKCGIRSLDGSRDLSAVYGEHFNSCSDVFNYYGVETVDEFIKISPWDFGDEVDDSDMLGFLKNKFMCMTVCSLLDGGLLYCTDWLPESYREVGGNLFDRYSIVIGKGSLVELYKKEPIVEITKDGECSILKVILQ